MTIKPKVYRECFLCEKQIDNNTYWYQHYGVPTCVPCAMEYVQWVNTLGIKVYKNYGKKFKAGATK